MVPYVAAVVAFVLGFLVALLWKRSQSAGEIAGLRAQVEERVRREEEIKSALVERESALKAAAEQRAGMEARLGRAEAELEAARREAVEKLALLSDARDQLERTFKAVAGETLKANSESFMALARANLQALVSQEQNSLDKRRESIERLMQPLSESLKRYEENLRVVEKSRDEGYAALRQQVSSMMSAQQKLEQETGNLVKALRRPEVRGRWGELTLRRTVELAGMAEHCDFSEQATAPGGLDRPDMLVHLPGGHLIVVDSKAPIDAYLSAIEAPGEEERQKLLKQHAVQVRGRMDRLAAKEYTRQFPKTPDITVMFLPGEAFFSAAAQEDRFLIEDGMKRGVVLATPTTLLALLRAVAYGWRQAAMEENAQRICGAARELHDRLARVCERLSSLGKSLTRAVESYNDAMGSVNSRLLPQARKMREMGATSAPEIADIHPVQEVPRKSEFPDDSAT